MKIDRRSFLAFGIGGTAGTLLSPLPWKLTDDISIWTQNWPWTPVPPDGAASYVNSTCTLCPGGCGITVRKIDQRAVKIEGTAGHPVNDGGICILGASGLQLLYGPTRVKSPLKRVGNRGDGQWAAVSWEAALAELGAKLAELRDSDQPHTVAGLCGSERGTIAQLLSRFLTVYGSPNFLCTTSMLDTYELTLYRMHGVQALPGFDVEAADLVLSFGSGIVEGWGSPVRMFHANSHWKDTKGRLIQVEPRLSKTAAKADHWIPINPGTEGALALGLAHVIIAESLYRNEFVQYYSSGFDQWQQVVQENYSPENVAQITGIGKETIVALAKEFAQAARPLAICGRGQGRHSGSLPEFMAVHALNALVGNINQTGGVWAVPEPDHINWPPLEMDAVASAGMQQSQIDGAGSDQFPDAKFLPNRLAQVINSGESYPLNVLLVAEANPLHTLPGTEAVQKAFEKIPYIVSFSSFMDETAAQADLVLPNHVYLERYEDVPLASGLTRPFVGLVQPVVPPQFNTRHLGDALIKLAQKMGGTMAAAFPWQDYRACLEETLADKWANLTEDGYWLAPAAAAPGWDNAFDSPSGKFEFVTAGTAVEKLFDMAAIEGDQSTLPLILVPYDSMRIANGYIGDPPFMVKSIPDTVLQQNDVLVEINPQTAQQLGLSEGQAAQLTTSVGSAQVRVHLYDGIMPGLVAMPRGLGHTAFDKFLAGKGVNVNQLIGPVEDALSGLDAASGIRAKLTKA